MRYINEQEKKINKRTLGAYYEQIAAAYLENKNYKIMERNFRCKWGEIDLIARENAYIIFIEVKYRKTLCFGQPREAINVTKRQHIYKVAQYYLLRTKGEECPCRFDVIEILGNKITHIEAAF